MGERFEWEEEREKQSSPEGREKMQEDEERLGRIQLHLKKRCGLWWPVWFWTCPEHVRELSSEAWPHYPVANPRDDESPGAQGHSPQHP